MMNHNNRWTFDGKVEEMNLQIFFFYSLMISYLVIFYVICN